MLLLLASKPKRVYVHRRITQRETCFFLSFFTALTQDQFCMSTQHNLRRRYGINVHSHEIPGRIAGDNVCVQSATQWIASVHTWHMFRSVITFVFKVLLHRYILDTCPNLWQHSSSKCYAMNCFGTYLTHVQTCDNVRLQNATQWTDLVHILHTCPNLWWHSCSKGYAIDSVITFVFKRLRNRLLRFILDTCPNLWQRSSSKCYGMDCFGTYLTHVQTCDKVPVQSATQSPASVYILDTCPNLW